MSLQISAIKSPPARIVYEPDPGSRPGTKLGKVEMFGAYSHLFFLWRSVVIKAPLADAISRPRLLEEVIE